VLGDSCGQLYAGRVAVKRKIQDNKIGKAFGGSITVKIIAYAHGAVDGDRKFGIEVGFFGCNGAPNFKKLFP
jgi:hypothetical protein